MGDAGLFVLGLLLLADVELLGGGLALGECVTVVMLALVPTDTANWRM